MRTTAVLLGFLNLTNMPSDSDKFKIIITLRRAQKSGDTDPRKISIFFITLYCMNYFAIFAEITCYQLATICNRGLTVDYLCGIKYYVLLY